jgi:hypothetical protein
MKVTTTGDALGKVLPPLIERARRVRITTTGGDKFDAYEPFSLAHDHLAFSTSIRADDTVAVRWEAIASIVVQHPSN